MRRWIFAVPLVLIVAVVAMLYTNSLKREVQYQPNALVGQAAPAVSLEPLGGGEKVLLTGAVQGPHLINVFGSWCVACIVEHPLLVDLSNKGVPIVGVAWRDKPEKTQAFIDKRGNPYSAVLMDPDGVAAIGLGITAAPESFLVDSKGKIIFKQSGPLTPELVDRLVEMAKAS